MPALVWDESTTRYFETGISKGILFPMGKTGVPWNGLVAVALAPSGGEPEHYYYDGVKYMDRVLAEDFQATIQAINTPREFEPMEGIQTVKFGMKTHFHKRDKFNMAWRTEIGNDEGQSVAYKLHIAYNCLVQPSARNYQTLSDSTNMDIRSFVITTTPACGKHSYYSFDSREGDLSLLEAQLFSGYLPSCSVLSTLVGAPADPGDGGDGGGVDPDAGCANIVEDFESYIHGQTVSDSFGDGIYYTDIGGTINNGLNVIELPAVGAFAANDSAASVVGTGDILDDDDDATYITSADGDLGYTVGLPPLVGYVEGAALELHIRVSISGGVNADDPDNLDADMQVHIATDDTGDTTVGGFSNGADEGMGFSLTDVSGTPTDYVIPLDMDAWIDTDIEDVVTVLEAGGYLNFVGATNNNPDTTPELRVYEAKVVMLDDTDSGLFLTPYADPTVPAGVRQQVFEDDTRTDQLIASYTSTIDFKARQIPLITDADGVTVHVMDVSTGFADLPGEFYIIVDAGVLKARWYDQDANLLADPELDLNLWYTVVLDWKWDSARLRMFERENPENVLIDSIHDIPSTALPYVDSYHQAWYAGDSALTYEIDVDNASIQVHCSEVPTDTYTVILRPRELSPGVEHPTLTEGYPPADADTIVGDPTTVWRDSDDATYSETWAPETTNGYVWSVLENLAYVGVTDTSKIVSITPHYRVSSTNLLYWDPGFLVGTPFDSETMDSSWLTDFQTYIWQAGEGVAAGLAARLDVDTYVTFPAINEPITVSQPSQWIDGETHSGLEGLIFILSQDDPYVIFGMGAGSEGTTTGLRVYEVWFEIQLNH